MDLQAVFTGTEFEGSENARVVLNKRYRKQKGNDEFLETHTEIFSRVNEATTKAELKFDADGEAQARYERQKQELQILMVNQVFLPNTPTIANAGKVGGQFSACFVLGVEDSFITPQNNGIMDTARTMTIIHQTGGGTGFNFSRLRPEGDLVGVNNGGEFAKGVASGPVGFLRMYDGITAEVVQGGMRRGANMGILNSDHPDLMKFIDAKKDNDGKSVIANFNISVNCQDGFMRAVKEGWDEWNLINPRSKKSVQKINPQEVWKLLGFRGWDKADPGVVFLDRANFFHQVPGIEPIEATNPCGEVPLVPNEPCNLGSINLSKLLRAAARYKKGVSLKKQVYALFDVDLLRKVARVAIRALENVLEENTFPTAEIDGAARRTRKLGLGVMGWADALMMLRIPYGSDAAVELGEIVMGMIQAAAREESSIMANERGNFPAWEVSVFGPNPDFNKRAHAGGVGMEVPMRNATVTCIAPTGSLSMIADCSSGIEPLFAIAMTKICLNDTEFNYVNEHALEIMREAGVDVDKIEGLREELVKVGYLDPAVFGHREWWSKLVPVMDLLLVSKQIHWEWHLKHQAAFQKHTCLAVSKTINCAEETTPEEVSEIYMKAYDYGCKGVTVYRENSLKFAVLHVGGNKKADEQGVEEALGASRDRPEVLAGLTYRTETGEGRLHTVVNYDEEGVREVFCTIGKAGGTLYGLAEALGRMISLALKYRVPFNEITRMLIGIRGASPIGFGPKQILSIPDAVGKVLRDAPASMTQPNTESGEKPILDMVKDLGHSPECPECNHKLSFGEGCLKCEACGYSKCT